MGLFGIKLLFQHIALLERKHQLGRNEVALPRRRIHGDAFHLFLHLKGSKRGYVDYVILLKMLFKYFDSIIYQLGPADLLKTQLDLCWVKVGGKDPIEFLKRFPREADEIDWTETFAAIRASEAASGGYIQVIGGTTNLNEMLLISPSIRRTVTLCLHRNSIGKILLERGDIHGYIF